MKFEGGKRFLDLHATTASAVPEIVEFAEFQLFPPPGEPHTDISPLLHERIGVFDESRGVLPAMAIFLLMPLLPQLFLMVFSLLSRPLLL